MTLQEEEQYLKEQGELVCESIAFWEKRIVEFQKTEDNQIGGSIEGEDSLSWFEGEEPESKDKELAYLIGHLQFDLREMERLDERCKIFLKKKKNEG